MDQVDVGVTLTPEENAFFESGGQSPAVQPEAKSEPEAPVKDLEAGKESDKAEEQPKAEKVVPLAALHEERSRRKDTEKRLRDIEIENARFRERFDLLTKVQQPSPAAPPNPDEDIFGATKHVTSEVEQLKQFVAQQKAQAEAQAQWNQFVNAYSEDAASFRQDTPDFDDAYKHFGGFVDKLAETFGCTTPQQKAAFARDAEIQVIQAGSQRGLRPAEAVYRFAQSAGYQLKPAEQPAKADAKEKLDTIERGQAANKSLSGTGGDAGADAMTAERLLAMPMDDFDAWIKKHPAQAKRLMGA